MPLPRHFPSFSAARQQFKQVFDSASGDMVTTIQRQSEQFLVVRAAAQREDLALLRPSRAEAVAEGGGWAVLLPGLPLHGDGETFEEAVDDTVVALREYAADWNERLRRYPNHIVNRPVVELVELSDDDQLRSWILGQPATAELTPTA